MTGPHLGGHGAHERRSCFRFPDGVAHRPDSGAHPILRILERSRRVAKLTRRRLSSDEDDRRSAGFALLDYARRVLLPEYRLTDYCKLWYQDEAFFEDYSRFDSTDLSADRKFFLRELLKIADGIEGDTAEAGVYEGASSWFICRARASHDGTHWGFDSFEGLSRPSEADAGYWDGGDLSAAEQPVRELLEPFGARVVKGWIPDVFAQAQEEMRPLAFAHIDVDLYEPTRDSMEFFYPRLAPGGIIVCDDYGFVPCPGATRAVDEYMAGRPEPVLQAPTGQGIVIKQ